MTSYQSSVSHENKFAERIFEAEKTTSVWDRGHQFRATQDFSHICFVSRHNPLTRKTCLTIVKQSIFYQKCVYNVQTMFVCVCWTKQLTPPTFSPCILVKLKRHDFAKWVKILFQIICKSLESLTSDDCWENAIRHVFQTAVLDDVNAYQRLAIGRYSSS